MPKYYTYLLAVSALTISAVAATFSVSGLAKLFAGAPLAVMFMAGSLEFAKLVTAAFLHRSWDRMGLLMRTYLTMAVAVLVVITSMGIFGYLSQAYQVTSEKLKIAEMKIDLHNKENANLAAEQTRLQGLVNAIPDNRVSRRLEMQKELEPRFQDLRKQSMDVDMKLRELNLERISYQTKIGPILYVAAAFGKDSDYVVRWLILMFVIVFDPLAICLIMATSFSVHMREEEEKKRKKEEEERKRAEAAAKAAALAAGVTGPTPVAPVQEVPAAKIPDVA